jgi:hypothetical protein
MLHQERKMRPTGIVALLILGGFLVTLVLAFSEYWTSKGRAEMALEKIIHESYRASERLQKVEVDKGLQSDAAKASYASLERKLFVANCIIDEFKSSHTTFREYQTIKSGCDKKLLEKDIETQQNFGVDYGRERTPG